MILAGHQPNYLPNLAFFAKMARADKFVVSTNLQFVRDKEFHRRNRLQDAEGNDAWLTVPVQGSHKQMFRDVRINNELPWREEHAATLKRLYGTGEHTAILEDFLAVYDRPWERLVDLNWELIQLLAKHLGITTHLVLDEETGGERESLLINTCRKHNTTQYLSGTGGRHYMDPTYQFIVRQAGITISFLPPQTHPPHSALHYLSAHGPEWVRAEITNVKNPGKAVV